MSKMGKKALIFSFIAVFCLLFLCQGCTPFETDAGESGNSTAADPSSEEQLLAVPAWDVCTVRVLNWITGTQFFVFRADGSFEVLGTGDLCSMEAYVNQKCPLDTMMSGRLTDAQKQTIFSQINQIYTDGKLLEVGKPKSENETGSWASESLEVSVMIGDEIVEFELNDNRWQNYPQQEYKDLIWEVTLLTKG